MFIDNKSEDGTRAIIRQICAEDKHVKAIFNVKNFGQFNSPYYAMLQSTGDATILMAADFQDPVEMIPQFVAAWEEGYKIAIGSSTRTPQVMHYLREAKMEDTFDFVGCGDLTTHGKPEPDLFLICAERLGVDPRACVVVEDSVNGVKAGYAAGGYVLGIPDMNDLSGLVDLCDAQIDSLDRIIPWMESLPKEISGLK